jgi:peptidoglycan L-alanyl-D-glutamate endopeptidase CwlK
MTVLSGVADGDLTARDGERLRGVHPDLVRVVARAKRNGLGRPGLRLFVIEGLRTPERQAALKAAGASRTLNSRHLTGHAVDLGLTLDGRVRWDWPLFHILGDAMKAAAKELGVPLIWGGDWPSFPDGPHFELPRRTYPA